MKRILSLSAVLCAVALIGVLPACDDDDNPVNGSSTGSVSGTVTFLGTEPATGDVQVSIYSTIMTPPGVPTGPPDGFTDPIVLGPGVTTYDYRIDGIEPGTYAAVFVGWRDPVNPSGAMLIGMHWIYVDSLGIAGSGLPQAPGPAPVEIEAGVNVGDLDILADFSLIP